MTTISHPRISPVRRDAGEPSALRAQLRHLRRRREAILALRGSRDITIELEQIDRSWAGANRALDEALGRRRR